MTEREREIVEAYKRSASLKEAADKLGVSTIRVHGVVRRFAPEAMRRPGRCRKNKEPANIAGVSTL